MNNSAGNSVPIQILHTKWTDMVVFANYITFLSNVGMTGVWVLVSTSSRYVGQGIRSSLWVCGGYITNQCPVDGGTPSSNKTTIQLQIMNTIHYSITSCHSSYVLFFQLAYKVNSVHHNKQCRQLALLQQFIYITWLRKYMMCTIKNNTLNHK